ncbi:substrate-binding periplasmic protein [Dongshaea marina]|uniref:substrate-binding periplasmic protein n=1 Tax=Dongshaea marina TaxID=2047966 RepID=UPI000D3E2477|nr:transporter substrate-binding domain-containing protein [Dongshaea marina]
MFKLIRIFSCAILLVASCELLAKTKSVSLTTLTWEPYIGKSMPGNGYVFELVHQAFTRAGYQVNIDFLPWARALKYARAGVADGIFPEYYGEERKKDFVFSAPFPGGPVGFYKRQNSPIQFKTDPRVDQAQALKELSQYRFGVVRGYINTKTFDEAEYLKKSEAISDEQNLKKLSHGRIDLIFIDKFVALHLLKNNLPYLLNGVVFMEPELEKKDLYIAFSKKAENSQQKLKDFNRALEEMKKDGTLSNIMMQHGF